MQVPGGPQGEVGDAVGSEVAAVPLVGDRRAEVAVAHDLAACLQGRTHDRRHMMGTVGGHEQRLGPRVELVQVGIEDDVPDPPTDRRASGLVGQQRTTGVGQPGRLGALAAPLAPLEHDEGPTGLGGFWP